MNAKIENFKENGKKTEEKKTVNPFATIARQKTCQSNNGYETEACFNPNRSLGLALILAF